MAIARQDHAEVLLRFWYHYIPISGVSSETCLRELLWSWGIRWEKMLRMRRRGCWDRTQHIPGWRRRAMWYENDTAVPALRTNDRTGLGNTLRNVSPSLLSAPIVPGKHWLSGCLVPSGCLLLLRTDLLFDSIPFLFSPALCLLCKHTHALRFDRLTRIHGEKQTEAHSCDSHQARRSFPAAFLHLVRQI